MPSADPLPDLVRDFTQVRDAPSAPRLLQEVQRHVSRVSRSYPDAWFVLGRKNGEAVADLGNRVFTTCARVVKGRFPFNGRTPFGTFVAEQFDGRSIRYHSFYAKLSVTREIMREDYARNLVRDPVLRWRADLYKEIGGVLEEHAVAERQGPGLPPRWRLAEGEPSMARPRQVVEERLKAEGLTAVADLVVRALQLGGAESQSRMTHIIEAVLGTPARPEVDLPVSAAPDHTTTIAVREAVLAAWRDLEAEDQELLVAVATGRSYDELVAQHRRFKHKVAVTRAVTRIGKGFVDRVVRAVAEEQGIKPAARPRDLVEQVLEVLLEALPELSRQEVA